LFPAEAAASVAPSAVVARHIAVFSFVNLSHTPTEYTNVKQNFG